MNLLKNNKTFEFFPALDLKLLSKNQYAQVSLISCNMQIPSLSTYNKNNQNHKQANKNYKKRTKQISNNTNSSNITHNLVNLNGDLYFYTGLKQYYKINIKKEILADYFVEEKKKLLYLNNQTKERSAFLSGDSIFPLKNRYEFLKRRFILNLHTRNRLKTNEALVEHFSETVNHLNNKLLSSLILKCAETESLPQLTFYKVGSGKNNSGTLFHFLGITRIFLYWRSVKYQYNFIKDKLDKRFKHKRNRKKFLFLIRDLPSRHQYLLQYLFLNLNKPTTNSLFENKNNSLLKYVLKEFMTIKLFLRFFIISAKKVYDYRLYAKKMHKILKLVVIVFNMTKKVYKNIFEHVFNLATLELMHVPNNLNSINLSSTFNALSLSNIYYQNTLAYKIKIFSLGITELGFSSFSFSNFEKGTLTRQKTVSYSRLDKHSFRHFSRKKIHFSIKKIYNVRYRNKLFVRRFNLLEKHNSIYFANKLNLIK